MAPRPDRPRRGHLQPLPHRRHLGPARPRPPRPLARRGGPPAPDPAHHLRRARRHAGTRRGPRRASATPATTARRPRRPSGAVVEARGRAPRNRGAAAPVRPRGGAARPPRSRAPRGGPARRASRRSPHRLRRRIEPRPLARGRGALRGLRRGTAVAAPRAPLAVRRLCALAEAAPRGRGRFLAARARPAASRPAIAGRLRPRLGAWIPLRRSPPRAVGAARRGPPRARRPVPGDARFDPPGCLGRRPRADQRRGGHPHRHAGREPPGGRGADRAL